jgi:predicted ATPase
MYLGWRFYDHFRSDSEAPARLPQLGTRTPVLHHDGRDLAAALQTIIEIGYVEALNEAVSDGSLRYLLWVAALLIPRPPPLMVLNEPETSLHPDLLPALGRLIIRAAITTQVWVVGQGILDQPSWHWPDKNT